jgi:hypothetical protein
MPQAKDSKKPDFNSFLLTAMRRGISPIQAEKPKSNLGKERISRKEEPTPKEKSIIYRGNLEIIRGIDIISLPSPSPPEEG